MLLKLGFPTITAIERFQILMNNFVNDYESSNERALSLQNYL